jgi:hypothetical protein
MRERQRVDILHDSRAAQGFLSIGDLAPVTVLAPETRAMEPA